MGVNLSFSSTENGTVTQAITRYHATVNEIGRYGEGGKMTPLEHLIIWLLAIGFFSLERFLTS